MQHHNMRGGNHHINTITTNYCQRRLSNTQTALATSLLLVSLPPGIALVTTLKALGLGAITSALLAMLVIHKHLRASYNVIDGSRTPSRIGTAISVNLYVLYTLLIGLVTAASTGYAVNGAVAMALFAAFLLCARAHAYRLSGEMTIMKSWLTA